MHHARTSQVPTAEESNTALTAVGEASSSPSTFSSTPNRVMRLVDALCPIKPTDRPFQVVRKQWVTLSLLPGGLLPIGSVLCGALNLDEDTNCDDKHCFGDVLFIASSIFTFFVQLIIYIRFRQVRNVGNGTMVTSISIFAFYFLVFLVTNAVPVVALLGLSFPMFVAVTSFLRSHMLLYVAAIWISLAVYGSLRVTFGADWALDANTHYHAVIEFSMMMVLLFMYTMFALSVRTLRKAIAAEQDVAGAMLQLQLSVIDCLMTNDTEGARKVLADYLTVHLGLVPLEVDGTVLTVTTNDAAVQTVQSLISGLEAFNPHLPMDTSRTGNSSGGSELRSFQFVSEALTSQRASVSPVSSLGQTSEPRGSIQHLRPCVFAIVDLKHIPAQSVKPHQEYNPYVNMKPLKNEDPAEVWARAVAHAAQESGADIHDWFGTRVTMTWGLHSYIAEPGPRAVAFVSLLSSAAAAMAVTPCGTIMEGDGSRELVQCGGSITAIVNLPWKPTFDRLFKKSQAINSLLVVLAGQPQSGFQPVDELITVRHLESAAISSHLLLEESGEAIAKDGIDLVRSRSVCELVPFGEVGSDWVRTLDQVFVTLREREMKVIASAASEFAAIRRQSRQITGEGASTDIPEEALLQMIRSIPLDKISTNGPLVGIMRRLLANAKVKALET